MLSVALGRHSRIVAPPELHLLRFESFSAWRAGYPAAMASLCALMRELGEPDDPGAISERFAHVSSSAVLETALDLAGPGRFVVDKTPAYARDPDALARLEGLRPFYVWLVRHPLGVASSLIEREGERRRAKNSSPTAALKYPLFSMRARLARVTGRDVREGAAYWTAAHANLERHLATVPGERQLRLHYEAFVRLPAEVGAELCAALGVGFEPAMTRAPEAAAGELNWGIGDQKIQKHRGIDAGAAERWRERYAEDALPPETAAMMGRLGVETTNRR